MNISDLETPFRAPRGFENVLLTALSHIYTGSCRVMPKHKVLKALHLLTAFHAGVNWWRWPVRPELRSTPGDGSSLQRLITTAIYKIMKTAALKTSYKSKVEMQNSIVALVGMEPTPMWSFLCSRPDENLGLPGETANCPFLFRIVHVSVTVLSSVGRYHCQFQSCMKLRFLEFLTLYEDLMLLRFIVIDHTVGSQLIISEMYLGRGFDWGENNLSEMSEYKIDFKEKTVS